jgi:hypothetical protein
LKRLISVYIFLRIAIVTVKATACIPTASYGKVARNAETLPAFLRIYKSIKNQISFGG